jgi:hypothetical protein
VYVVSDKAKIPETPLQVLLEGNGINGPMNSVSAYQAVSRSHLGCITIIFSFTIKWVLDRSRCGRLKPLAVANQGQFIIRAMPRVGLWLARNRIGRKRSLKGLTWGGTQGKDLSNAKERDRLYLSATQKVLWLAFNYAQFFSVFLGRKRKENGCLRSGKVKKRKRNRPITCFVSLRVNATATFTINRRRSKYADKADPDKSELDPPPPPPHDKLTNPQFQWELGFRCRQ